MKRHQGHPRSPRLTARCVALVTVALVSVPFRAAGAQAILILIFGDKIASEWLQGGIKADLVWSTLAGTPDADRRRSYGFGGFLELRVGQRFSIQPEFTFKSPAGATGLPFTPTGRAEVDAAFATASDVSVTRTLGYVTLPVLAKVKFGRFAISAGPQVGYVVKATDHYTGTVAREDDLTYDASLWSRVNRWDTGVSVLAEFSPSTKRGFQTLRVRASWYRAFGDALGDAPGRNDALGLGLGLPIGGAP
jgi:Outer membrane protein beta-barrel domain